jgi:hypothetical protein
MTLENLTNDIKISDDGKTLEYVTFKNWVVVKNVQPTIELLNNIKNDGKINKISKIIKDNDLHIMCCLIAAKYDRLSILKKIGIPNTSYNYWNSKVFHEALKYNSNATAKYLFDYVLNIGWDSWNDSSVMEVICACDRIDYLKIFPFYPVLLKYQCEITNQAILKGNLEILDYLFDELKFRRRKIAKII